MSLRHRIHQAARPSARLRACLSAIALLCGALLPFAARAAANADLARCASEQHATKRLECFDRLSKQLGVTSPKSTSTMVSKWKVTKDVSPIDDSVGVSLALEAGSQISGWPAKVTRPTLVLRCKEGQAAVYIVTGMSPNVEYGHDSATVTLRFDKEKSVEHATHKSTDGEALFFGDSTDLMNQMVEHASMLFQFTPFNSSPTLTTFDLRGLATAIKPLKAACAINN